MKGTLPGWVKIITVIVICNLVGLVASGVTLDAIPGWYDQLNKPFFTPPDWIFGPVWVFLYTLMGISAGTVWHMGFRREKVKGALSIFGIQLMLNGVWSFLFFGLKLPLLAFIEIILLFVTITITFSRFKALKPWTAWLLLPYLLWVGYAALLNLAIYLLN